MTKCLFIIITRQNNTTNTTPVQYCRKTGTNVSRLSVFDTAISTRPKIDFFVFMIIHVPEFVSFRLVRLRVCFVFVFRRFFVCFPCLLSVCVYVRFLFPHAQVRQDAAAGPCVCVQFRRHGDADLFNAKRCGEPGARGWFYDTAKIRRAQIYTSIF